MNPSPNLRSLTQATLYGGVALLEGTNISVGRGTNTPFELLGAPWIKARDLAAYLNGRAVTGVRFVPTSFTPDGSTYAGQLCQGVNILVTNRDALDAPELGLELVAALRYLYPEQYKISRLLELLGSAPVLEAITAGEDPRRIAEDWRDSVRAFEERRKPYLLY